VPGQQLADPRVKKFSPDKYLKAEIGRAARSIRRIRRGQDALTSDHEKAPFRRQLVVERVDPEAVARDESVFFLRSQIAKANMPRRCCTHRSRTLRTGE